MNNTDIEKIASALASALDKNEGVKITLDAAKRISERTEAEARRMGVNAVVAVVNEGARPVLIHSMDDAYIASYDIALNKAYTSASLKMSTFELKKLAQPGEALYGIQFTNQNRIVIFGGGEPVFDGKRIVGAVGVSGGTEEQDTLLGAFAAKAAAEELQCRTSAK